MRPRFRIVIGFAALAGLAACVEDGGEGAMEAAPKPAEQACLRAVIQETGNGNARVASTRFSEAGTEVIVEVGDQRAPWQCIAYRDGTTSRPLSLTDEGAL